MQNILYVLAIGYLIYAPILDIDHQIAAKKVMRYLQRIKKYILTYKQLDQLDINGYSDFDFTWCQYSFKFTLSYICLLIGEIISWKRAKKSLISPSTTGEKFIVCYETSNHVIWLRNSDTELEIVDDIEKLSNLFFDNNSTVLYSNKNKGTLKSKHIEVPSC